jgi:hypothetical protein
LIGETEMRTPEKQITWKYVEEDTPFDHSMFYKIEMCDGEDLQRVFHSGLGSITVLDRITGFGFRDVESGFRDKDGKFWLASGNVDIIALDPKTFGEAIKMIKFYSNTCVGA